MDPRRLTLAGVILAVAACAPTPATDRDPGDGGGDAPLQQVAVACSPSENMPVAGRSSPYDSTAFNVAGQRSLVCYGRPSVRERTIFGGLVPYGQIWRTVARPTSCDSTLEYWLSIPHCEVEAFTTTSHSCSPGTVYSE